MSMTHYMELLAVNQPWNLLIFMAGPVVLAETLAISELFLLLGGGPRWLRPVNRAAGILAGLYFTLIVLYLVPAAVVPLTLSDGWRGPLDVVAVGAYLLGGVPLAVVALLDLGLLGRGWDAARRLRLHVAMVAAFLVVAHVAMVFGMLDPALAWTDPAAPVVGHDHADGHGGHH